MNDSDFFYHEDDNCQPLGGKERRVVNTGYNPFEHGDPELLAQRIASLMSQPSGFDFKWISKAYEAMKQEAAHKDAEREGESLDRGLPPVALPDSASDSL